MMQKRFEFENEVIEEELFQFSEEEVDRLFLEKPWLKKYLFIRKYMIHGVVHIILRESRYQLLH